MSAPVVAPSPAEPARGGAEPTVWLLLFALGGGMTSWALHLWALTSLVPAACDHDLEWLLHLCTVVTAAVTVVALVASVRILRGPAAPIAARNGRTAALGLVAALSNAISLLLILLEGFPVLVLDPCRA